MIDIILIVLCIIIGGPLVINPNKFVNSPKCRIKSPAAVRVLGILIIILSLCLLLF